MKTARAWGVAAAHQIVPGNRLRSALLPTVIVAMVAVVFVSRAVSQVPEGRYPLSGGTNMGGLPVGPEPDTDSRYPLPGGPGPNAVAPPDLPLPGQNPPGLPFSEQGPAQQAQPQGMVVAVEIVGNTSVSENRILREMRTRQDRYFEPQQFMADVRRLYRTGLFRSVDPSTRQTPDGVVVRVQVTEQPTMRYVAYHGNRSFKDKTLAKETGLKKGEAFNTFNIEDGRRRLEEFYHRKGFPKASVAILEGTKSGDKGVVYEISEGFLVRIWDVDFVGNDPKLVTDARLKTLIESKPGWLKRFIRGQLDRDKVDEDTERLTAYYRSLGYFRARVGCETAIAEGGNWADLTFVIDQGPRYVVRNATVGGNRQFASEDLQSRLELKSGEHFNLAKMNRDLNTLRDLYGSQGYVFADIKAAQRFREEDAELDLVYNVQEGDQFRVGQINIHIAGEFPHTRHSTILNRLSINPGDIIDIREVRNSERRLMASQLFENDAAQGKKPEIRIRPPELSEDEGVAQRNRNSKVRGQSPDDAPHAPRVRYVPVDVFLPPWKK